MNKKPWNYDRLCEQCGEITAGAACRHLYADPTYIVHVFTLDIGLFAVQWERKNTWDGYILRTFKIVNDIWTGISTTGNSWAEPDYNVSWAHLLHSIK